MILMKITRPQWIECWESGEAMNVSPEAGLGKFECAYKRYFGEESLFLDECLCLQLLAQCEIQYLIQS